MLRSAQRHAHREGQGSGSFTIVSAAIRVIKLLLLRGWRDGSALRSIQRTRLDSQDPQGSSQPAITPVPVALIPSLGSEAGGSKLFSATLEVPGQHAEQTYGGLRSNGSFHTPAPVL